MSFVRRLGLCSPLAVLLTVTPFALAQQDVVIMKNGDRITGEIKEMKRGVITIDPDYGDNIFGIEWKEVERIESKESFIIETAKGDRVAGTIQIDPGDTEGLVVQDHGGPVTVERPDVVWVRPFEGDFWSRLNTTIDLGGSVAKAAGSKQVNLASTVGYLEERWGLQGTYDWNRNIVGEEKTNRWEADARYTRLIGRRWFALASGNFLSSDELQLNLRTTVAPGFGRYLKRTNSLYWSIGGGVQWVNENFTDPALANKNSGEGWFGTEVNLFDIGGLNWLANFRVSPSFTETGRVRMDFRTDVKYDLPRDLYIRVGLSDNYDSRPLNDAPKNDYVFSYGIGWEFP